MNLGMDKFWILEPSEWCLERPWVYLKLPFENFQKLPKHTQAIIVGSKPLSDSAGIHLVSHGTRVSDYPYVDGLSFVVTEKFIDTLEPFFEASVKAVLVDVPKSKFGTKYYYLNIAVGASAKRLDIGYPSVILESKKCVDFISNYGIYFDASSWCGFKMFRLGEFGNRLIVVEHVARAVVESTLVGVSVVRLDRYGGPDSNIIF